MRAYVINLADAVERRKHMEALLSEIGIPFERFDALNPEQAARHPRFDQIPPMRTRPWIPEELGCLLSHYEVWQKIAGGADEYGLVLEDDVLLDARLLKVFEGKTNLPPRADLVKLETGEKEPVLLSRKAFATTGGPTYRKLLSLHYGTGAYLVSRRAAKILVESVPDFDMPVDNLLFTPTHPVGKRFRTYQAIPALAIQNVNLPEVDRLQVLGDGLKIFRESAPPLHNSINDSKTTRRPRIVRLMQVIFLRFYQRFFTVQGIVLFGSPIKHEAS